MKIQPLNFLIALLLGALLTYAIVSIDANSIKGAIGVGAFILLGATLATAFGLTFTQARTGVNMRIVALIFFAAALLINLLAAVLGWSMTSYVVTCGVLFLLFVLVAQSIFSTGQ